MSTYLDELISAAEQQSAKSRRVQPAARRELNRRPTESRDFAQSLRSAPGPRVIAQFKRATFRGALGNDHRGAGSFATACVDAGAAAISVASGPEHRGSMEDLIDARGNVHVPVICSDIVVHQSQIEQARDGLADAVILMPTALTAPRLRALTLSVLGYGMTPIFRVHSAHDVERALACGGQAIEVSLRDLETGDPRPEKAAELRPLVPKHMLYLAGGGLCSREQVSSLREVGLDAIVLGEHLCLAEDPGLALSDLMG